MKKLFHLGLAAFFAITISSCSKSGTDLAPNQNDKVNSAYARYKNSNGGLLNGFAPGEANWGESKFYEFIHQPYELALGDPDNSILNITGNEFAAVFVVVSYNISEVPVDASRVMAVNNVLGEIVGQYQLVPCEEAANYGVKVPDGLDPQSTYFAVIPMTDLANHIKNTISLYSDITSEVGVITAQLENAFLVML